MTKKIIGAKVIDKIFRVKKGTRQILFSYRVIIFTPKKHFVNTDEAKEFWRKEDHISKEKMKSEFCSVYAASTVVGRGRKKHIEFNKTTKQAADVIFIIPNKYRREAFQDISKLEY